MFKNLLGKGKCALGLHEGAWRYAEEGNCRQVQVCERCAAESERLAHGWGDWHYTAGGNCSQERICGRCGEAESQIVHQWLAPTYATEGQCEQARVCRRCGEQQPAGVTHHFDAWVYTAAEECTQAQACSRCGTESGERRIAHQWGGWEESAFYEAAVRVCARCGALQRQGSDVTLQAVEAAAIDVLQAAGWPAVQQALQRHQQTLFSPLTPYYFRFAYDQYPDASVQQALGGLEQLLANCRQVGIEAAVQALAAPGVPSTAGSQPTTPGQPQAGPAPASTGGQAPGGIDPRLVGHWRRTESMASGGYSYATDYHLIFEANGTFTWYSKTAGSFGSSQSGPEYGRWSVSGGRLVLQYQGGAQTVHDIYVEGYKALVDGNQLWERIG